MARVGLGKLEWLIVKWWDRRTGPLWESGGVTNVCGSTGGSKSVGGPKGNFAGQKEVQSRSPGFGILPESSTPGLE